MVAESNHARRPAFPGIGRRLVAALLCAPLLLWPTLTASGPAAAAVAGVAPRNADAAGVGLDVTPSGSSILHLDQPLQLSVTVTNDTADSVAAGTVDVFLAERALTTRTALTDWLDPGEAGDSGDLVSSVALDATVQPHSAVTLAVTVPFASLGLFEWSPWGPRGISASLSTENAVRASAQSTFVWYPDTAETPITPITPVDLAVTMPIVTPTTSTGLISADDLTAYTAPSGILTRQLDGVLNRAVAIAIDPMIIASIRVLGSSAPASAVEWLDRLARAENDIFPLGYADADPSLAVQAGAAGVLAPTALDFATDPSLFVPADSGAQPWSPENASDSADPQPIPTDQPAQPGDVATVPTLDQLLAWDYTTTSIAWPADNAVATADIDAFAGSGLTTTILTAGNAKVDSDDPIANTAIELGPGELGLVADTDISLALRAAVTATTDERWRAAMAELSSQIAVVAVENPGRARTLLATLDRGWPPTASRLSQTLDAVAALPWYTATPLTTALATPVSTEVGFAAQTEPGDSVQLARRLVEREAELTGFSAVLPDPTAVLAPNRLALLALLATSWASEPSEWRAAVEDNLTASNGVLQAVTVSTTGPINVVGSKVDIPVTLTNALGQAVTVRVQAVPSNGRLVVGTDVEAVIDASSAKTVSVPVTAAVGNGAVTLRVTLYTPAGAAIGTPALISVNVRADWEGIGSRIFAALVVLFFGFGIWRNIVHRRRNRAFAAQDSAAPDADLEAGADAPPTGAVDVVPTTPAAPAPVDPGELPTVPRG